MATLLLFLAGGAIAGYLFRRNKPLLAATDRAANGSIYLLVFFLGASVGINKSVVGALHQLGWQALILSLGGVTGSVLVSAGVYFCFFREKYEE